MKHITLALIATLALLTGCATTKLTPEQAASADYGESPANYEQIVKDHFSRSLFDPYSAQYRIGTPYQGFSTKAPILGGGPDKFGYLVDVGVNGKNRFGGYVGEKQFRLLIKNGQVIREWQLTY
jgi:hypothetical protein